MTSSVASRMLSPDLPRSVPVPQALHVVLRMYDRLSTQEPGGFIVKRKAARGAR